jgi:hypothetical protein
MSGSKDPKVGKKPRLPGWAGFKLALIGILFILAD